MKLNCKCASFQIIMFSVTVEPSVVFSLAGAPIQLHLRTWLTQLEKNHSAKVKPADKNTELIHYSVTSTFDMHACN